MCCQDTVPDCIGEVFHPPTSHALLWPFMHSWMFTELCLLCLSVWIPRLAKTTDLCPAKHAHMFHFQGYVCQVLCTVSLNTYIKRTTLETRADAQEWYSIAIKIMLINVHLDSSLYVCWSSVSQSNSYLDASTYWNGDCELAAIPQFDPSFLSKNSSGTLECCPSLPNHTLYPSPVLPVPAWAN